MPSAKNRLLNSALAAAGAAVALAAVHSGCGHDVMTGDGYTTVHIGSGAAQSMEASRRMNLMQQLSTPPGSQIETIPTGSAGGIIVMAQLIGGGQGAVWVPQNSGGGGVSWTLPNGAYNFSAIGYDGAAGGTGSPVSLGGQSGPYCGLALGDAGRGTPMVLAGTSRTVDILMGATLTTYGASGNGLGVGSGPAGSASPGSFLAPTCGMTPFITPNPTGSSGCVGSPTGQCFMPTMGTIGFCSGASGVSPSLPAGNDTTGSSATSCSGLNGPSGGSGGNTAPAATIASLMIQFFPFSAFNKNLNPPAVPISQTNTLSICVGSVTNGLFTTVSTTLGNNGNGIPLFPIGSGNTPVGGPAEINGATPAFGMMTALSIFGSTNCSGTFLRTYFFPYGINMSTGSTPTGNPSFMQAQYLDATSNPGVFQSADTMAGFWVSGGTPATQGTLWIQYP